MAPKEAAHKKQHKFFWELVHATLPRIRETLGTSKALEKELQDLDSLQDAVAYHQRHAQQVSERLTKGHEQVEVLRHRLQARLKTNQRLDESTEQAAAVSDDRAIEDKIQQVNSTKDELWKVFAELYSDEIQQEVQQKFAAEGRALSSDWKPADIHDRTTLRNVLRRNGVEDESVDGWSAEQIYQGLFKAVEDLKEEASVVPGLRSELEAVKIDRDDISKAKDLTAADLERSRADRDTSQGNFEDLRKSRDKWMDDCHAARKSESSLKSNVQELEQTIKTLKYDLEGAKAVKPADWHIEMLAEKREQIKELNNRIFDLEETESDLQEANTELRQQNEQQLERHQKLLADKDKQHSDAIDQLTSGKGQEHAALQNAIRQKEAEYQAMVTRMEDERRRNEERLVRLLGKVLRHIIAKTELEWDAMRPLSTVIQAFAGTPFRRRFETPVGWDAMNNASRAQFVQFVHIAEHDPVSDFAAFLCTCLDPGNLGDQEEVLSQLGYLNDMIHDKYVTFSQPNDMKDINLTCLFYHLNNILLVAKGVNYAWASCLVVQLMYAYEVPLEDLGSHALVSVQGMDLLHAAGVLRLRMALRVLSGGPENSALPDNDTTFSDPRFKAGIELQTHLALLSMPSFLLEVCAGPSMGKNANGESFMHYKTTNGDREVVAVSRGTTENFFLKYDHDWGFQTDALSVPTFDGKSGIMKWKTPDYGKDNNKGYEVQFERSSPLYDYAVLFHGDKLIQMSNSAYEARQRETARKMEELKSARATLEAREQEAELGPL